MIAILGAGSLGRLWAASLPPGQVSFVPRPSTERFALNPPVCYRFQTADGSARNVAVPWLSQDHTPTLCLVTTKAGDTLNALAPVLPQLPGTCPIVLFQNGLGSQQQVAGRWPDRPILAATTTDGANRPEPDALVHAGRGETWVGPLTKSAQPALGGVVEALCESGLRVQGTSDILPRLWQKLIVNAGINPITALLDCPNGAILDAPFYQRWIHPLCLELSALLRAAGQPAQNAETLQARIEAIARATAANTSSMRADVMAGRQTEIDFINGYLVRLGQQLGIDTPVNRMLTERVQQLTS
ncbi:MAG TPA: 2-dehydropantoate 2-reductase [Marinobacter sp.]|nr:2-dehydropantoate 2-reductase [Marinobacter sp.]